MPPSPHRVLRLVRAVTAAGTALSLGVGAHVLGGGHLPATPGLIALAALTLLVTSIVTRWRLRLLTIGPALGLLQLLLHGALSVLPARGSAAPGDPSGGIAGGAMSGMTMPGTHPVPGAVSGTAAATLGTVAGAAHAMPTGPGMLVAHVLATVATALLLVGADRAARATLHWAAAVLPLLLDERPAPVAALRTHRPPHASVLPRPHRAVWSPVARRGPPVGLAAT